MRRSGALEKAASAEQVARAASNETLASRQSFALVAAAAAAGLVVLLLLPAESPRCWRRRSWTGGRPAPATSVARRVRTPAAQERTERGA